MKSDYTIRTKTKIAMPAGDADPPVQFTLLEGLKTTTNLGVTYRPLQIESDLNTHHGEHW